MRIFWVKLVLHGATAEELGKIPVDLIPGRLEGVEARATMHDARSIIFVRPTVECY